jgi:hypothetical protein
MAKKKDVLGCVLSRYGQGWRSGCALKPGMENEEGLGGCGPMCGLVNSYRVHSAIWIFNALGGLHTGISHTFFHVIHTTIL